MNGPRITPADIETAIAQKVCFNAYEASGVASALRSVGPGGVPDLKALESLKLLTICVLVLKNGYTVVGKSACVSPENFNEALGQSVALEDAMRQVWPLLGYALRDRLHQERSETP